MVVETVAHYRARTYRVQLYRLGHPPIQYTVKRIKGSGVAVYISTADKSVTYTKERPRRRDRHRPRTRLSPGANPTRKCLHRGRTQHMSLSAPART